MTVKDLIDAALFCDALEIVVRENGNGEWIQGYRISKYAEQFKCEYTIELQEKIDKAGKREIVKVRGWGNKMPCLSKDEIRDVFHGFNLPMKIIKKDISKTPEHIANLKVCSFQPRHIPSFHKEQLTHNEFSLEISCFPEGFVPETDKKVVEKDDDNQCNEISIFDLMKESE